MPDDVLARKQDRDVPVARRMHALRLSKAKRERRQGMVCGFVGLAIVLPEVILISRSYFRGARCVPSQGWLAMDMYDVYALFYLPVAIVALLAAFFGLVRYISAVIWLCWLQWAAAPGEHCGARERK
ncbi:MAG: hypothetical protein HYX69_04930 [Planctomycetia bacterium]|nr:hypothetical protein [Planctomycetia bacterium]